MMYYVGMLSILSQKKILPTYLYGYIILHYINTIGLIFSSFSADEKLLQFVE